jgi:restriction system protein
MQSNRRNPDSPWNPLEPVEISPTEFEHLVRDWYAEAAEEENQTCTVTHLGIIEGKGGTYKVDVLVKLSVLRGHEVTIIAECKHQRRPVEREEVMALQARLDDTPGHKGAMFSTSGFQSGAIKYAGSYGIATVTVTAGEWLFETKALGPPPKPPPWVRFDRFVGIRLTPTNGGIGCDTIEKGRPDALREWLNQ